MCTSPGVLPNGQLIGCRKCWQCKERRVDDWVGRCIAESKTARACHFVTLTYGESTEDGKDEGTRVGAKDHERTAVLTYSDVQKFLKKVRFDGYKVKYFAVGEYGSLKGRAHWHLLMFWQDKLPPLKLMRRIHSKWWADEDGKPLGFVRWERLTSKSIRYAMKYLQKDIGETDRQGYFAMSKKPPLGSEYFVERAKRFVEQGLAPQDLRYGWPNVLTKDHKQKRFCLGYNSAERFIDAYVSEYIRVHGNDHYPDSELVDMYRDKKARKERQAEEFVLEPRRYGKAEKPFAPTPYEVEYEWDDKRQAFVCWDPLDGTEWFWSFNDEGNRAWTRVIVAESDGEKRREEKESSKLRRKELQVRNDLQFGLRRKPPSKSERRRMRDRLLLTGGQPRLLILASSIEQSRK